MPAATRNDRKRPDPDSLLALSRGETGGRLRVFLGAAPGVGKTFAMLNGARRLMADGLDVVVGLVETHGRSETQALIEGLEILPRRTALHRPQRQLDCADDRAAERHGRSRRRAETG
jgi:two-component system, OmpR family, sensor histidine kinase KdpD